MKAHKVLTEGKLARSRTEAENLIKQGAVSIGACIKTCTFFDTGHCTCGGWQKVTNPAQELPSGWPVKVSKGFWRVLKRLDGQAGFEAVNGVTRVP